MLETFTFLNQDPVVVAAFVKETAHLVGKDISNHHKINLYRHYFPDMVERTKYTGFERVKDEDIALRHRLCNYGEGWLVSPDPTINTSIATLPFEELIKDRITQLGEKNLVFFSGGLDSEFLIRWFMKFQVPFCPVIIRWIHPENFSVINMHDIVYAYNFCKKNGLMPKITEADLGEYWKFENIIEVSKNTRDTSPQRCAYKMVSDMLGKKFPDYNRIFAGEIRYRVR